MNIYSLMYNEKPPKDIERKKAYIVGGCIAGLSAAVFLIDDAHIPGENITFLKKEGCSAVAVTPLKTKKATSAPESERSSRIWNAYGICAARSHR